MTDAEKLSMIKVLLEIDSEDISEDNRIATFLIAAAREIIAWRYSYVEWEEPLTEVPAEYEMTQIYAVVAGYSQSGAENQISHNENGISRVFSYPDMIGYIRAHVISIVGMI